MSPSQKNSRALRDAELLQLVALGVPYEVAAKLSPAQRLAYTVVLGELRGNRFDWNAMRWSRT